MNIGSFLYLLLAAQVPQTTAERTNYAATSSTADVGAFLDSLELAGAPVRVSEMGSSALGKPIYFVIASDPTVTSPGEAAASGKVVVYLQANIHGGEVEGKEAVLALLRELAGPRRELLQTLVVLVAPDYNPDGNDAFGPQAVNRSEQNGPALVGQRADGKNLDLNRDYFKAEAPETRASLARVYTTWDPALMVDLHTTDGTLHGYQLTYAPPLDPNGPAGPTAFVRDGMLPALRQTLAHKYHEPIFDYGNVDTSQAQRSWDSYAPYGWYGTNYVGLRGRMAILSEAYSHADFKTRVRVTHDFLVEILNYVARHGDEIRRLERAADRQTALEGAGSALRPSLAVAYKLATRGVEPVRLELRQQVGTYRLPVRDRFVDSLTRALPAGYFLPAADSGVAALLRLHGIQVQRLTAEWTDTVEVLTGTELKWATREFQGHQLLEVTGTWARASRRVPAGGYFVSPAQPLSPVSFALLEPEGVRVRPSGAVSGAPGSPLDPSPGREFPAWPPRAGPPPPPRAPAPPPPPPQRPRRPT